MIDAIKTVLAKYFVFSGRAARPEYWYWLLAVITITIVLSIIEGAILAPALGFEGFAPEAGQPLQLLFTLAICIPSLAVTVRRLHDIGRSGWWILIQLVPFIGALILIWWLTRPSDTEENQYGVPT